MRACLIHGPTQSPHGWDLLVKELMAWGVAVTAVDLPCADQGAEYFARLIAQQLPAGEPPMVVAHSAAGLLLPVVAGFVDVARLVYLAAIIPTPGSPPTLGETNNDACDFDDCEARVKAWALTTIRPWCSPTLTSEKCPLPHHPRIPTTYISATLDRTIDATRWERKAQELGFAVLRMNTGHAPHVSEPRELARLLMACHA